jgi:uncharacterized protein YdbL (DUF1318 family)
MSDEQITLKLESVDRRTVTVNRAEYEQAKAAGTVGDFLDVHMSNLDNEASTVTEPDGTTYDPYV